MAEATIRYAGFWKRVVASIIDAVLMGIVLIGCGILIFSNSGMQQVVSATSTSAMPTQAMGVIVILEFVCVGIVWLYFALFESSSMQATLGKACMRIIVTDTGGNRLTFARATGRFFSKLVSQLTYGVGYIFAGFTKKKQALHDMIADTLVINKKQPAEVVMPPETELSGAQYAGFWKRYIAATIDGFIASMPYLVIFFIYPPHYMLASLQHVGSPTLPNLSLILSVWLYWPTYLLIIIGWLYYALFESSVLQATPGKIAMGIIVTDLDGSPITFLRATGRYFGKVLSSIILFAGYIMAGFTQKKQALHDMIAGTLVVNKYPLAMSENTIPMINNPS